MYRMAYLVILMAGVVANNGCSLNLFSADPNEGMEQLIPESEESNTFRRGGGFNPEQHSFEIVYGSVEP